jgi:glycosyltransferase involved in cell wall biosynthesis
MSKTQVYHFYNGCGGGVFSVIKNILRYAANPMIEHHVIYTINRDQHKAYEMEPIEGATSMQLFNYSANWNFYYTSKQLVKLLPNSKVVVVAHDWLELGMVSQLGLQNPVVSFLHGDFDYYYKLATLHQQSVDAFICISPVIQTKLLSILPSKHSAIFYKRFPIPDITYTAKENQFLHAIYCVRDLTEERKQFELIPIINRLLLQRGIVVKWTIAGRGLSKEAFQEIWGEDENNNVDFLGGVSNQDILQLLQFQDLFLLPSLQEGLPVALVEAMKAGVIPLITNWNGATAEFVIDAETGFYCPVKDAEAYVQIITKLHQNRMLMSSIAKKAINKANTLFNPVNNALGIESALVQVALSKRTLKIPVRTYGSRLDQPWIPNALTFAIRKSSRLCRANF